MGKDTIFVYTGTGNSFATACQIAAELDMDVVHIVDELAGNTYECDNAVMIFPVYAYGMPKTCRRFILKNRFKVGYMAVLTTIGSAAGGAHAEAIKLFKRRKQRVHYSNPVKCVENFVHMFKLPPEEVIALQIEAQRVRTNQVIEDLKTKKTNKRFLFRPDSRFVSIVFRSVTKIFAKRYKFTDACNGCGVCYRVCPPKAIEMTPMPKVHPKKCDHCQACMQLCPRRAIRFGKIQPEGRRYKHTDVKLTDLYKRPPQENPQT